MGSRAQGKTELDWGQCSVSLWEKREGKLDTHTRTHTPNTMCDSPCHTQHESWMAALQEHGREEGRGIVFSSEMEENHKATVIRKFEIRCCLIGHTHLGRFGPPEAVSNIWRLRILNKLFWFELSCKNTRKIMRGYFSNINNIYDIRLTL